MSWQLNTLFPPNGILGSLNYFKNLSANILLFFLSIISSSISNETVLPDSPKCCLMIYCLTFQCSVNTMESKDRLHHINFWSLRNFRVPLRKWLKMKHSFQIYFILAKTITSAFSTLKVLSPKWQTYTVHIIFYYSFTWFDCSFPFPSS